MEELKELRERVARLEREIEQLKQKVQTREVVIVDQDGNHRACLELDSEGNLVLRLVDAKGEMRIRLTVDSEGPTLKLGFYAAEKLWATLAIENAVPAIGMGKVPMLKLYNAGGGLLWREP